MREAENYEQNGDWENAAKYHKETSKLFGELIGGIDMQVKIFFFFFLAFAFFV